MAKEQEQNLNQIIRKDAKNCFVEALNDKFQNGRLQNNGRRIKSIFIYL